MQAFEASAAGSAVAELDSVVFEAPFGAFEGNYVVDIGEELGDGQVVGGGAGPDELDIGNAIATDEEA